MGLGDLKNKTMQDLEGVELRKWRTRQGPIRTESLLPIQIKIPLTETMPLYQKLGGKIKQLKALGMTNEEIAARLKINRKTVGKGLLLI